MEQMDEAYRNRAATILQALYATKYAKEDNVPCQIEQGLFLGSIGVAHNKDILKRFNVTHILIVAKSLEPAFPNDFVYKKIEVLDSPDTNLEQHFDECFNFIDEAKRMGGSVLVHCFAGKSRSVTIIVAYLMKKHHMSISQALDLVRSKRPQVAPNYGFMLQLQKFEKSLRAQDRFICYYHDLRLAKDESKQTIFALSVSNDIILHVDIFQVNSVDGTIICGYVDAVNGTINHLWEKDGPVS